VRYLPLENRIRDAVSRIPELNRGEDMAARPTIRVGRGAQSSHSGARGAATCFVSMNHPTTLPPSQRVMHPKYAMASLTRCTTPIPRQLCTRSREWLALQRTGCGPMTDSNSNFSWLSLPGTAV
jgi:hypothetical protein